MFEAMMIAATGIAHQQRRLDTIADNVANVNTVGFKESRLDFKDALYTAGMGPAPAYTPDGNLQKGHGVLVSAITKDFRMGSLSPTGSPLDFAIEGDAFFELMNPDEGLLYTRAGNMYISNEDDAAYIVNSDGYYLHNEDGERIVIPAGSYETSVARDGTITFYGEQSSVVGTDKIGLFTFTNNTGLANVGSSNYEVTPASGEKMLAENASLIQGSLEMSNVDLAGEMTRLIRTQRAFSLASRALTTADDMEGIANNIRR